MSERKWYICGGCAQEIPLRMIPDYDRLPTPRLGIMLEQPVVANTVQQLLNSSLNEVSIS